MKLNKSRAILLQVIILTLVLGLLPAQAQDVTLRYFMWDAAFEETEQQMVDICKAELGINVEMEAISPTSDYWINMQALAAADDLPDVFFMSSGFIDEWIADDLLLNIQEYVDRDIMPDADNYFTNIFDVARAPDKTTGDMYAFPFAFVETVLFYNQDAFDAAGLEYPSEDGWTWDEFLEAAKALTLDNDDDGLIDQYGFWFYGRYAHIESWVYNNGGSFLDDTRTEFAPDDNAVEALEFLISLVQEHGVAPERSEMEGIRQQDIFPLGLAAMWVDGGWNIDNNRTQLEGNDLRWAIAPVPQGPSAESPAAYGWPDFMAIAKNTEHPEESWAFIECMTGELRTVDLAFSGKLPIYAPTADDEAWLELDQMPPNKSFLLNWGQYTGPTSFTPGWGEWRGYVDGAGLEGQIDAAVAGEVSLEDALAAVTETANAVLDRFYGDS